MKKRSFKLIAVLMAMLMVCVFALTACSKGQGNTTGGNDHEASIITPNPDSGDNKKPSTGTTADNGDDESSRNPGDITDKDLPVIPEDNEGVKIVLPKNVNREILSYTYASISMDLMSYGYEVFNGYVTTEQGDEYGIAYSDGEEAYKFDNDEKVYFSTGFLGYSEEETVSASSDLLYVQPVDSNAKEIEDDTYGYVVSCVEGGIPAGHFIVSGKYVKYSIENSKVSIDAMDNIPENYDISLGAIYDYDKKDIAFMPFDAIDSSPIQFVPLTENIDYAALKASLYQLIEEQTKKGYSVQTITISFLSVDTLNALRGILAQGDTLNGYTFDALNSLEFDSAKQYINFSEDGTITIKDLPPIPVTEYKTIFDWLIDGLILVGAGAIAIVSVTFLGPAGGVIAGAVLGAGIEYFSQTVIQGKKFSEVNWTKVGIMAISGALGAMVPCGSGIMPYLAAGAVGGLTSAALTAVDGGSWQDILISAGTGAFTAMLMHGLFSSCFPAGTQILTKEGYVAIELVSVGMLVASYNERTNEIEWKPVLDTFTNYATDLTRVYLSNGDAILSTSNHPYFVAGAGGYISANALQSGDKLLSSQGELFVVNTERVVLDSPIAVYNFRVMDNSNYFVDDSSVLVHNSCSHQGSEWRKTRSSFWKDEVVNQKYAGKLYVPDEDNLARMFKGKAPLDSFNKSLELHHIDGISNSMSNIIPLDKATHTAFHQAKGYVGFTAQDLFDFLKSIGKSFLL